MDIDIIKKDYFLKNAEEIDVDLILDMKLDIILNNERVFNMNKNELEKEVLEAEEDIRENLNNYQLIEINKDTIGFMYLADLDNEIIIEYMYLLKEYRDKEIMMYILKDIIKKNYKPINIQINKNDKEFQEICKNLGFVEDEEFENEIVMRYENDKVENVQIKADILCKEVSNLCKKYNMKYFFYTENRSVSNINNEKDLIDIKEIIEKR